jgi:hypothetical protein
MIELDATEKSLIDFLRYSNKVYGLREKINSVTDYRKKPKIPAGIIIFVALCGFLFRIGSFNQLKYHIKRKLFDFLRVGRSDLTVPSTETVRRQLKAPQTLSYMKLMNKSIVNKARRNGVLRRNAIRGYKVVAIDGVELFNSTKKCCDSCLMRVVQGVPQSFHGAVVAMSVGPKPNIVLGTQMLEPKKDGCIVF